MPSSSPNLFAGTDAATVWSHPEHEHFIEELRHLLYFSHRIIFSITADQVTILRIHNVSRQPIR